MSMLVLVFGELNQMAVMTACMHACTYVHACMHACMHSHLCMHACMYVFQVSPVYLGLRPKFPPERAHHRTRSCGCCASVNRGGVRGGVLQGCHSLSPYSHQTVHTTGHCRMGAMQVSRGGKRGSVGGVPRS